MNTLMNYPELDAFAAQKNAGSKNAYFKLLDTFVETAPKIAQSLTTQPNANKLPDFLRMIDNLQSQLLGIGSSTLVWEAEKVATLVRDGQASERAQDLSDFSSKLKTLCVKLEEAKHDGPTSTPRAIPSPASALKETTPLERPTLQAAIKPEPFEKLGLLVENFELDDALVMLCSLMKYTYNMEIDFNLATVEKHLAVFDYDNALQGIKRVLQITRTVEESERRGKKKILAVDDVPDVLNTLKSLLDGSYAVYGVTNHKAALKYLTGNTADLILLDIEMPHMNGFTLLNIIRKIKACEKTPVIFLTSSVSVENVKKSFVAGGSDFIKKPINAEVLRSRIEKHLGSL